jgi:PAS domain S-box-containing protein
MSGRFSPSRLLARVLPHRQTAHLRDSEARFRSLTELSSDFLWETDAEHRYTLIELGSAYAGVRNTAGKLGAARWDIAYTSPDEAAWGQHRAAIAARQRFVHFRFSRIEDGEERFYEHSGEPRYDASGNFLGYRGVGRDVTARKRAEEALRQSEERYVRAMAAAEAGFWDWDVVQDKYYVSPRLLEMAGLPPGTTIAGRADFQARVPLHPEDLAKWQRAIQGLFASGGSRLSTELRVIVGAQTRWYRLDGMCFRDAGGEVVRWTGSSIDVTSRKVVEEALRVSEQRSSLAMEATQEGHFDLDLDSGEIFMSERLNEIYGFPPGTRFANRSEYLAHLCLHADDAEKYHAALAAAVAKDGPARYEFEFRIVRASREVRWLWTRGKVTRDAEGRARRRIGVVADITERKLAEEALRESEARKSAMFETALDCIVTIDHDGRVVEFNPAAERTFGYRRPEALGKELAELIIPPRLRAQHRQGLARYLQGSPGPVLGTRREMPAVRADGHEFPVELTVTRIATEGAPLFTAYLRDITERQRSEEALRNSEQRYALAMEAAGDGHTDWDLVSGEHYISPRLLQICGYAPGTSFRDRADWVRRFPFLPEDRAKWEQSVAAHFAGRESHFKMELRIVVRGEVRWTAFHFLCTRDAAGTPIRWTGSIGDITEQKRIEEALRLSESRYAVALEVAEEGHWDWNVQTDEIFASPQAERVMGLPADTEYRTRGEIMAQVRYHPDDGPRIFEEWRAALAGRALDYEFQYRILRGEQPRWIRGRWKVFRDAAGVALRVVGIVTDLTARKLAEDALRASEERYSLAMEASEEGYVDVNVDTDEFLTSERLNEIFGIARGTRFASRADFLSKFRFYGTDGEVYAATMRSVMAKDGPNRYEFEFRIVWPSGEVRWLWTRGQVTRDAEGRARRRVGVVADVTARRQAVETLREREARFRALTELSSDAYWVQDENLRFLPTGSKNDLAGYPSESHIGKTRWELSNATPLSGSWAAHEAVLQSRKPFRDFEYRRTGPDGSVRYLSISGAPIFDEHGLFRGYQGVGRDITDRKRVEEALHQSEERYALAVAGSNEGIFDWDLVSDRMYMSQRAQELFGLPLGELWRPRPQWRSLVTVYPDDARQLRQVLSAHIAGEAPYDAQFRVCMPDGSVRWFRQRGIAVRDASGKAYRMVGSIGDVTEKHKAEEELRRLERQLRQAQRLEAMGTLAGGIAHDFNNILGAILGYSEMALRDAPESSRLRRDLDSIVVAGERGRALVDRVLAFSRSGVADRVPVHVEKLVREGLDLVSARLPPNVTLHAKLHAGCAALLGDPTQVLQVLMNLATNAIQAMPAGGTLRVHLDALRIDTARVAAIGMLSAADYLVLKVTDTGTGIAPEIMERIFDPFFTTKEVGTGTGLGLSLVHGIVSDLGGAIDVASTVGTGTVFTVYLPRSGDAPEQSEDEEPEMPRGEGQRVLVVDDEEPLVRLATRTLEELGYAPVGFTSSIAALAAFRADPKRFDAVITDERMPGLSGSALIREVRSIRHGIPIVLMSGFVGAVVARQVREVGAEEVLKKPLSARDLAASLSRVLHS